MVPSRSRRLLWSGSRDISREPSPLSGSDESTLSASLLSALLAGITSSPGALSDDAERDLLETAERWGVPQPEEGSKRVKFGHSAAVPGTCENRESVDREIDQGRGEGDGMETLSRDRRGCRGDAPERRQLTPRRDAAATGFLPRQEDIVLFEAGELAEFL